MKLTTTNELVGEVVKTFYINLCDPMFESGYIQKKKLQQGLT